MLAEYLPVEHLIVAHVEHQLQFFDVCEDGRDTFVVCLGAHGKAVDVVCVFVGLRFFVHVRAALARPFLHGRTLEHVFRAVDVKHTFRNGGNGVLWRELFGVVVQVVVRAVLRVNARKKPQERVKHGRFPRAVGAADDRAFREVNGSVLRTPVFKREPF